MSRFFISKETRKKPAKYWKYRSGVPIKIESMNDNYIRKAFNLINEIEAQAIEKFTQLIEEKEKKILDIVKVKETLLLQMEKRNIEPNWDDSKLKDKTIKNIIITDKITRAIMQQAKERSDTPIGKRLSKDDVQQESK